jgi:hypothetical protein
MLLAARKRPVMDAADERPLLDDYELLKRITVRSDIFGGKPIIRRVQQNRALGA